MTLTRTQLDDQENTISCWKLGPQVTGGRWYEIYRARPKTLSIDSDFDYVIKTINPTLPHADKQKAIDRLGREAFATEAIMHNAVIRLLDAELDKTPFFLVQPWVYGRSLDRFFASAQQVAINRLMWVLRQVAEGIHAGHQCGRVYLGLDPSHVLLGRTGRVKLIGWSQSHGIGERVWLPHDQIQAARYMAPECFADGYRASTASDVYSLGALIYQSLTLETPYSGSTLDSIKQAVRQQSNVDLMIRQPLCPRPLYRLVRKMLSKNPHHRPEFGDVLESLISIEIEHLSDMTVIPL
ncbi:serine/threonine protein kinase [Mariniblastus fucicola]|nr:serine/threonine-protein kinase [Mariniblastus fucicola]